MSDLSVKAIFHQDTRLERFMANLTGPGMLGAAAMGLNEHAGEQRRMSIVRITNSTGVPKGRVSKMKVNRATPGPVMMASVTIEDETVGLHEYGKPSWSQGMAIGARATGWNVTRNFKGAFYHGGAVLVRTGKGRYPLKVLSMAVLANELAKPARPNVPAAEAYVAADLTSRVMRHVVRFLG